MRGCSSTQITTGRTGIVIDLLRPGAPAGSPGTGTASHSQVTVALARTYTDRLDRLPAHAPTTEPEPPRSNRKPEGLTFDPTDGGSAGN